MKTTKTPFNSNDFNVGGPSRLTYLFNVDLDGPVVIFIQGFEGTWI